MSEVKESHNGGNGRVYVASSWRCETQPSVVDAIRQVGIEVYDFKHPAPGNDGFHWSAVMPSYNHETCDAEEYTDALVHPIAEAGFKSDFDAMQACDTCVLVLPCGRSAHLELGWFVGQGKRTAILLDGPVVTPELMYKMVDFIGHDIEDILGWLTMKRPTSLSEACRMVMEDQAITEAYPEGMTAGDVLTEIRAKFGRMTFPLCSMLDVHDELTAYYGRSGR